MIVDDDFALLKAIEIMLEPESYLVKAVENADSLLRMTSDLPDLIFLDFFLQGKNGEQICRQLKRNKHTSKIPIVLISAKKDLAQVAKESGADDYLFKPFRMVELVEKINRTIG